METMRPALMRPLQHYCCIFTALQGRMENPALKDPTGLRSECTSPIETGMIDICKNITARDN